jgi:putative FmdB family regulatory protein
MPTYSYRCDACKREFETEQRISDPPIKKCPKCGKQKARRMISSSNFILKGGGWYSDGYGSSKGNGSNKSKDKESTAPSKDSSTSSKDTASTTKEPAASSKDSAAPSKDSATSKPSKPAPSTSSD